MLKFLQPKPIFLGASKQAVLLLHSYTSTLRDMKPLAEFLHQHNFSTYAINYTGHGLDIDQFIQSTPEDWLNDAIHAFQFLQNKGYTNIAVIGVSLGAILSLRLCQLLQPSACIVMSTPYSRSENDLFDRLKNYALYLAKFENKTVDINELAERSKVQIHHFQKLIQQTITDLDQINQPISINYGKLDAKLDAKLYQESADYILEHVHSAIKTIQSYPHAGHLMTLSSDQAQLYQDILHFLKKNL